MPLANDHDSNPSWPLLWPSVADPARGTGQEFYEQEEEEEDFVDDESFDEDHHTHDGEGEEDTSFTVAVSQRPSGGVDRHVGAVPVFFPFFP